MLLMAKKRLPMAVVWAFVTIKKPHIKGLYDGEIKGY
jgi:hypothetical protein